MWAFRVVAKAWSRDALSSKLHYKSAIHPNPKGKGQDLFYLSENRKIKSNELASS